MIPEEVCVDFTSATKSQRIKIGKILLSNYKKMVDKMVAKADYGTTTGYWKGHIPVSKKIINAEKFIAKYGSVKKKNNIKMKSKFKDLKFISDVELNKWLKKVTFKIIDLKDNGQDMQKVWVHKTGEILNCDFHSSIYCGKFIDMKKLVVGNHLNIWDEEKKRYKIYEGLFVESLSPHLLENYEIK